MTETDNCENQPGVDQNQPSGVDENQPSGVDEMHSATADAAPIEVEVQAEEPETSQPLTEVERLTQENEALKAEKKETYERLLRAVADLDNFRKRSRRELQDGRIDARGEVLKEMLPVIDNLERAVQHAESNSTGNEAADGILDGVRLVLRQFGQALERCEVTVLEAVGQPFDPNVHDAISQMETGDHPAGSVISAVQRGYKIGNRLLRPSLVVVAKALPVPVAIEPEIEVEIEPEIEVEIEPAAPSSETAVAQASKSANGAAVEPAKTGDSSAEA